MQKKELPDVQHTQKERSATQTERTPKHKYILDLSAYAVKIMGRKRTKEYPDYVIEALRPGYSVHEIKGTYYLYRHSSATGKFTYCGKIMPDSTIVHQKTGKSINKLPVIDASTPLDSLIVKDYVATQTYDYEFGFTHFLLNIIDRDETLLQVTDKCAIITEIILSISPDSYLSKNATEKEHKHFFSTRKKELILNLGKMGVHFDETYDLLKSIRMYETADKKVSISRVSEAQSSFLAKWNVKI